MNRKGDLQHNCPYMPIITTPAVPLLLFGQKKTEQQTAEETSVSKSKPRKLTGFPVVKYEIAEDKIKFSNSAGLFKKRWVVAKEFPVYEITVVESLGTWLSLSWNNEIYQFILKRKGESFAKLVQQIAELQEAHQKNLQKTQQASLRRRELLDAITVALPIVDCSFDILMGLHEKHVGWMRLESYAQALGDTFSFKAQTLASLDLDFAKIVAAVQNQTAKETAQEAFGVLRAIHDYFSALKPQEDLADTVPNFEHAKRIVLAYFTLNDLWFAKIVGETDIQKEFNIFEMQLADLSGQTGFKVMAEEFRPVLSDTGALGDGVWNARQLFRERLKQL
ncbi:MAG: hypothetical protein LBI79_04520 [Nitrososphaerota archaeon]|nr:hypothetical protein [Nitrososphaerota archaeon]